MEEITITRALAELKLLDSRIQKKIAESEFVFFISKKNKSNYSVGYIKIIFIYNSLNIKNKN